MSTSTVSTTNIVGTKTGPELVSELNTQLGNAKTDLEARPTEAGNDTVSGNWTFTGIPISQLPAGGGLGWRYILGDLEAAHTTKHEIEVRGDAAGTLISWAPKIDGTVVSAKRFGFKFDTEQWSFGENILIAGSLAWHAGNFNPLTLSPTTLNINGAVAQKVTVLTAGAGVAINTNNGNAWWLANDQAMTLTFTWPSGAHATLGANYKVKGEIQIRNESGHGALSLAHNTAVTDSQIVGTRPTGATELYTLQYQCTVIGASRYVQFTWVGSA